jgi:hypothetical protein
MVQIRSWAKYKINLTMKSNIPISAASFTWKHKRYVSAVPCIIIALLGTLHSAYHFPFLDLHLASKMKSYLDNIAKNKEGYAYGG